MRRVQFFVIFVVLLLCFFRGSNNRGESASLAKRSEVRKIVLEREGGVGNEGIMLPPLDQTHLLSEAKRLEESGRYIFAKQREVDIAPRTHGHWHGDAETAVWSMEIGSVGAESLNFGFREFFLPVGGELWVRPMNAAGGDLRFSSSDNDAHGELWTPIFLANRVVLELSVPRALAGEVRLTLGKVNHGFRSAKRGRLKGIGDSTSGRCHVDVVCSAADDGNFGPMVDLFRDQIRSVGAFTVDGIEICSGALINNTRNDATPYFLTAEHCGLSQTIAPSVVVYWNFENSTCRTPGSEESGSDGNGSILEFNSGAIFRASFADTDFCLIELDDPVESTSVPFFAGWDRRGIPASMAVGIHHPGVSEKRISIEVDPTTATDYYQNSTNSGGTHVRVGDWDFGTTEGGSSGSPLFDQNGRIIGQLSGGEAACGNDGADWYGRLSQSLRGGGTSESRLLDWLDPLGTGVEVLEGVNADVFVRVNGAVVTEGDSGSKVVSVAVRLSEASDETIRVRIRTENGSASADDFSSIDEELTFDPGVIEQFVPIMITGDLVPEEHESFSVVLSEGDQAIASSEAATVMILNNDYIEPVVTSANTVRVPLLEQLLYQIKALNTPTGFAIENGPAGLEIDEVTGRLTWLSGTEGLFTVEVIASNPAGEGRMMLSILVTPNSLVEALDLRSEVPLANGDPGWVLQTSTTHDGVDAAQAGSNGAESMSEFSITLTGPDVVGFWWKVESEERFDFLSVHLDGAEVQSISGQVDWVEVELAVPAGSHTLAWRYRKDDSQDMGADTGWVDELSLGSASGLPVIVSGRRITAEVNEVISYEIESLGDGASYQVSGLPPGLSFDGVRTISGSVDSKLTEEVTLEATLPGGEMANATLVIQIVENLSVGVDNASQVWQQSGSTFWGVQSAISHDGVDAVRSGNVAAGESSIFSAEITGPDAMSFYWRVDSEQSFDLLLFKMDGVVIESISGFEDWSRVDLDIPSGRHVISWEYFKDENGDIGADAGWVDEIRFRSDGRPFIQVDAVKNPVRGEMARIELNILNSPTLVTYPGMPEWLEVDPETGDLVGVPPSLGSFFFSVRATNHLGTGEVPMEVRVIEPDPRLAAALDLVDVTVAAHAGGSWISASEARFMGGTAAESVSPGDDGASHLIVYVRGPGRVSFDWGVSSEEEFDFLEMRLNDQILDQITGEVAMEERELSLEAGIHEISFVYRKDNSVAEGLDRGWVDNMRLEGFAAFLSGEGVSQLSGEPDLDGDGDGFGLFEEYALGGRPDDPGSPTGVVFQVEPDGGPSFSFRGLSNPLDVDYEVQTSESLRRGSWSDTGLQPTFSDLANGYSLYRYQGFPEGDSRRFFRYKITPKQPN